LQATSNSNKQQESSIYRNHCNFIRRNQSTSSSSPNNNEGSSTDQQSSSSSAQFFPWRRSPTPPTRLLNNDDYSGMPNNIRARFVRKFIAAKELNLSLWDVLPIPFYKHEWEEELARNFSKAFCLAISELGRTVFPGKGVVQYEDDCVYINNYNTINKTASAHDEDVLKNIWSKVCDKIDEELLVKTTSDNNDQDKTTEDLSLSSSPKSNNTSIENNDYLNLMMDQRLLQQYQHLMNNNNSNNIQIRLVLKPIAAKLENIFAIPMLTRDIVTSKPHLKGAYQRLEAVYKETKSYAEVKQKTYELAEQVGLESAKRTVIAEATITCLEYFQVRDISTNEIIQDMTDPDNEKAVHLVRFELVTDRGTNGKREIGNWKLIDIDDLLEGNVFH